MGSATTFCSLEIKVLSAENLRLDGKSVRKDSFVVVRVDSFNYRSTKADLEGGSNPSWNEKLEIDMTMHARSIALEVQCKIGSGNRVIGMAGIPVSDFIGDYAPPNSLHFLSYRLRDLKGQRNGIINVSVRVVKGLLDYAIPALKNHSPTGHNRTSTSTLPSRGFRVSPVTSCGLLASQNSWHDGGVVTGVPAWWAGRA